MKAWMRWMVLVAALEGAAALAQAPQPTEKCDDEQASCRETCSLEFGTTYATRGRLSSCLNNCDSRRKTCVIMVVTEQGKKAEHSPPPTRAGDDEPVVTPMRSEDTDAPDAEPVKPVKVRHGGKKKAKTPPDASSTSAGSQK